MNRPLVWFSAAFAIGMFAAASGVALGMAFPLLLVAFGGGLVWVRSPAILGRLVSVLLVAFGAGALLWNARHQGLAGDPLSWHVASHPEIEDWTVEGKVRLSGLETADSQRCDFYIDADTAYAAGETLDLRGGVSVRWGKRDGTPVYAGDRVRVKGGLTVRLADVNFGVLGYEDYLRRQGIHSSVAVWNPRGVEIVSRGAWWSPANWSSRLRETLTERLRNAIPEPAQPFVFAVWLGHRTTLPDDEYERYIQSGTAHILSISGIHMAMVYVTVSFALGVFVPDRRRRAVLIMACVGLFVLMSGVRLSALRAALMVITYVLADLFDREPDAPTALSISALLLLGWNPDIMFDTGFQLSFASVASILLYREGFNRLFVEGFERLIAVRRHFLIPSGKILDRPRDTSSAFRGLGKGAMVLRGSISVSLAVQVLPTPLAVNSFHVLPLLGIISNLAVIPLSSVVLWLCMLTSLSALVSPGIASLFGHAIWPVVELIRMTIQTVTLTEFSHLILVSPTVAAMVCYCCAAGAGLGAIHGSRRKAWLLCGAAMLALTVFLWRPLFPQPEVVFLDVGHGDSVFVRSREGKTLLVDGGDRRGRWDVGQRIVAPFLWSNHVRRLDYVAASHGDTDHIGGLEYILRHFEVGTVLMSVNDWQRPHEKAFMQSCADLGVPIRRLHAGETFDLGGTEVEVLHPPIASHESEELNNNSLVLRLRWEGTTVLLPGDIEAPAEATVSRSECRAAVLKAPHHGSKTSSSTLFLDAVLPVECIVSTGGTRGHESCDEEVLARYVARGMRVWRTDVMGGIRLIPRHGAVTVEAARPLRGYPRFLNAEDPLRDQASAAIR